jgi:integrase
VQRSSLTDAAVKAARPPTKGFITLWCGSLKGFGCMVSQGGTKSFCVLVASGRRKVIGKYPLMSVAEARRVAREMLAQKTLKRTLPTRTAFDDAKADFLSDSERRNKPRTVKDYTRLLNRHFPFGRRNIADITPREIVRLLNGIDAPAEKRYAAVVGKVFFRWCLKQHLIERSPLENMAPPPPGASRERILTPDELGAVYRTARRSTGHFPAIVALLVLTGQRRGEMAALQWDWISGDIIEFPAFVAKNNRPWTIPLGPEAQNLLAGISKMVGSPYVFPALRQAKTTTTTFAGWGRPKARFDAECGVTGWTLHDLRRTFSSNMAALGVPQIVVEKLLNHVSGGTQSPISQVYNRYSYLQEMRQAVLTYERWLATLP